MESTLRIVLTRIATPAVLVLLTVLEKVYGGDGLPAWLANMAIKTGAGVEHAVQVLMAVQLTGAAVAVIFRRVAPAVAWITFVALSFSGLAELSAVFMAPGNTVVPMRFWLVPLVQLAVGVAALWGVVSTAEQARIARMSQPPARVTVWRVLLVVCIATVAAGVASRTSISARNVTLLQGVETVVLDPDTWEGKTIPGTGLAQFLPALTPLTLEGTKWIVFYQPSCGRCHDVFRTYFAGDQLKTVFAVQVPHAPNEKVLESDQRGEVECDNCTFLSLPKGRQWLGLTTPTIVKVENGKVVCVEAINYSRCRKAPDELE